jgi:hypothetical protein
LFYGLEIIWFPQLSSMAYFSFEYRHGIWEVKTCKKRSKICIKNDIAQSTTSHENESESLD